MNDQKNKYARLGMLMGIFVGGGLATILLATTSQAIYLGIVGVGLALGLLLGAGYDRFRNENG